MAITYQGSTSFTMSSPTVRGGTTWEQGNRAVIVVSSSNALVQFDLTTMAQVGSGTTLSSPAAVTLIDSASAVIISSGNSTVDFYELSSNTRSNVAGGITGTAPANGTLAADPVNKIALYVNFNGRSIGRINGNNFTVTNFTFNFSNSNTNAGQLNAIVFIGNRRWIVADALGNLFEIDDFGNCYKQFLVNLGPSQLSQTPISTSGSPFIFPRTLQFSDNMLLVQNDSGMLCIVDWTTGETIWNWQNPNNNSGRATLSNAASGVCMVFNSNSSTNPAPCIVEMDLTVRPGSIISELYLQSLGVPVGTGFSSLNSRGWIAYDTTPSTTVRFFSLSNERITGTRTFTVQKNGTDVQARLIVWEDGTLGRPFLDTLMQSPATYRVPTGKTMIELTQIGEGETAEFSVSRYST
jgi:outer membrane protein assembly factor BamB